MSYRLKDKRERNERLVKFAIEHPDYTHNAIAKIFHISRVRVTRILNKFTVTERALKDDIKGASQ